MADFNLPLASSLYVDVLTYLKLRDIDALTLCFNEPTNIPDHSFKYERNLNLFQAYEGGTWRNKVLSVLGGGTGATNPNDIRINLGLGSMALQAASAVAITGGTMNGVAITNATQFSSVAASNTMSGNLTVAGSIQTTNPAGFYGVGMNISRLNAPVLEGLVPAASLGSGAPSAANYLRGDRTWAPLIVNPSRWTKLPITSSLEAVPSIINQMTEVICNHSSPIYINLTAPNNAGIAVPSSPLRIVNKTGVLVTVYANAQDATATIVGRTSFIMDIPHMSIDILPDAATNSWSIF